MRARRTPDNSGHTSDGHPTTGFSSRRLLAAALLVGVSGWVVVVSSGGPVSVQSIGSAATSTSSVAPTTTPTVVDGTSTTSTSVLTTTTSVVSSTTTTMVGKDPPPPAIKVPDAAAVKAAAQRFCSLSSAYLQQVRLIEISLTNPDRLRELLQAAAPAAKESVAIASKDLQPDAARVSGALGELRDALEAADYQLAKVPPGKAMNLQSPPVQGALNRVEAFARKGC